MARAALEQLNWIFQMLWLNSYGSISIATPQYFCHVWHVSWFLVFCLKILYKTPITDPRNDFTCLTFDNRKHWLSDCHLVTKWLSLYIKWLSLYIKWLGLYIKWFKWLRDYTCWEMLPARERCPDWLGPSSRSGLLQRSGHHSPLSSPLLSTLHSR